MIDLVFKTREILSQVYTDENSLRLAKQPIQNLIISSDTICLNLFDYLYGTWKSTILNQRPPRFFLLWDLYVNTTKTKKGMGPGM